MTFSYSFLVIAVVLLWLPRAWMRKGRSFAGRQGRSRHRSSQWHNPPQDGVSLAPRREFTRLRNYFDLVRGVAGTWALVGGYGVDAAVRPSAGAPARMVQAVLALQALMLVVGVLVQLLRWERGRLSLNAPVFYVAGLVIALNPVAGTAAFVIAWLMSPIVSPAQGFLTIQTLVLAAGTAVFVRTIPLAVLAVVVSFLPVVISLLARRPLVVFSRRAVHSGAQIPAS